MSQQDVLRMVGEGEGRRQQEQRKAEKKKEAMSKSKIPEDSSFMHSAIHPFIQQIIYCIPIRSHSRHKGYY